MTEWEKEMGVKLLGLVTFRDSTEVLKLIKREIEKAVDEVDEDLCSNASRLNKLDVLGKRGIE